MANQQLVIRRKIKQGSNRQHKEERKPRLRQRKGTNIRSRRTLIKTLTLHHKKSKEMKQVKRLMDLLHKENKEIQLFIPMDLRHKNNKEIQMYKRLMQLGALRLSVQKII